jgi:predicted nucleotidyltransferase
LLAIFGSVARDEARPDSDVDILVEFEGSVTFDRYMDVKFYLEDLLETRVDLVSQRSLKPLIRSTVEQEAIYVA